MYSYFSRKGVYMPTTYAHWRFGDKCIRMLPDDLQNIILNNRAIFDYGVHGPDIFFYYNCLKHNEVNRYGSAMHDIPYKDTLAQIKENFKKTENKDMALSYLLGFTCHFTLDSYCHGFIEKVDETMPYSHGKIESQFDRYLLIKDGFNPVTKSVTDMFHPDKKMAKVISGLFNKFDEDIIYKTLKDQKLYLNLLKDNSDIKRFFLTTAMDIAKVPSFKDLLITKENVEELKPVNIRLNKYFDMALKHYPVLADSLIGYLSDKNELNTYFKHNFSFKEDYRNLEILPLDEELKYKVTALQD
ncbi:MAG: zinc dependent phospholipase C family protein [Solobacterium sp.]|nr:zinc dependent phospholipase C family protein [Solobacterium sp.]MCI7732208.1 zinc dependent phospholipase C family protein [Solobacterium sp.]MDD5983232.1 zinc dependent phospholipase C family protein [Solobacterium sp.]MDD6835091.1 zinc dependent phospholipase C family protein [Solobacterium sp.]MDD6886448.1 zinc dependent phospholipase C family protein [Solobacterium sp.]